MVRSLRVFAVSVDMDVFVAVVLVAMDVDFARPKKLAESVQAKKNQHCSDTGLELCFDRF